MTASLFVAPVTAKPSAGRLTTDPEAIAGVPIRQFEGLETFRDLPQDGRCVSDYWF